MKTKHRHALISLTVYIRCLHGFACLLEGAQFFPAAQLTSQEHCRILEAYRKVYLLLKSANRRTGTIYSVHHLLTN